MRNIFLVAMVAVLAACGPAVVASTNIDPCDPATYNEPICQQAVAQQGYYNNQHIFVHHVYAQPFGYYRGGYNTYVYRRRTVVVPPTTIVVPRTRTYYRTTPRTYYSRPVPRTYYRYRR